MKSFFLSKLFPTILLPLVSCSISIKTVTLWETELHLQRHAPLTVWWNGGGGVGHHLQGLPPSVPLILGDFGASLRTKHHHLTSFVFVVEVPSTPQGPSGVEGWILRNGNKRKDRFIFLGEEGTLTEFFKLKAIRGLGDKLGLIVEPAPAPPPALLVDPILHNPRGEMWKVLEPQRARPLMGRNLRGRRFKVTGCLLPTWLFRITDENHPKGVQYDGSNYRLVQEAGKQFNFTFELFAPVGQGYGDLLPNGTWVGMVSDLIYLERGFDFAILLGHVLSWFSRLDFASPLDFANLVFLTSRPQLAASGESFTLPFQFELWLALISTWALITGVILLINCHSREQSPSSAAIIPYSIAVEQQNVKIGGKVRLLAALWMATILITGTGYRSNLASFLSVPSSTFVPSTLEELARAEDYSVVLATLGVAEQVFFEQKDVPVVRALRQRMSTTPDPTDCAKRSFLSTKTACISWTPLINAFGAEALTLNPRVDVLQMSQPSLQVSMSMAFVKDSVIVDAFTLITGSVYEAGIYGKWVEDGFYFLRLRGKSKMERRREGKDGSYEKLKEFEDALGTVGATRPFSLANLFLPFHLLGAGFAASLLLFVLEKFHHKCIRKSVVEKYLGKL